MAEATKRVAVIPGDGVGPEVVGHSVPVIERALFLAGGSVDWTEFSWGSDYYKKHGRMMPKDALETLSSFDAIVFGAVGDPAIPDHVTVWGLILPIRRAFDQYVNYRPVRWLEGVPARLANKQPEEVDMLFVRENIEGEYANVGGRNLPGYPENSAVQTSVFTERETERIARYAFERARERRGHLTSITKSNAMKYSMVLWDEVVERIAADFPDVTVARVHVDAAAYKMVVSPEDFDVVVASNLFGDILTDLGAALQGSIGLAASGNLDPTGRNPSAFEPIHGSAPDIAGKGLANPAGTLWAGALMLENLGFPGASRAMMRALERACRDGLRTPDLGGKSTTREFAEAVSDNLSSDKEEDHG
jgi:tartrate dehydrogenase/decarboxylase/D-malate dehydrogenase